MEKSIYFDNAATTPLDTEVAQRMLPFFSECFGNADSPHAFGRKAMVAVDCARDVVAAALRKAKRTSLFPPSNITPRFLRRKRWKRKALKSSIFP